MPSTPYPHTHHAGKFRALKNPIVNDDGEFTHKCLNCEQVTAFEYEDFCEAGCDVLVVECVNCSELRERTLKD